MMRVTTSARVWIVFAAAAVAGCLAGCLGEHHRVEYPPRRPGPGAEHTAAPRPALDERRAAELGFSVYWDSFIRDEVITSTHLEGDQLYAYTRSNRLYQVGLHSGEVHWVYDVGYSLDFADTPRPICEWVYAPDPSGVRRYDELFFVAQGRLVALDKANGAYLWSMVLPFTPSAPPQANDLSVFVGSWDDRVYAIRKSNRDAPAWSWRTGGDVLTRPAVHGGSVFVGSTDGTLYTFEAQTGRGKWPFPTERALVVDPLVYNDLLYVASDDDNLYVANVFDGRLEFRYACGAPVTRAPVAIDRPEADGLHGEVYVGAGAEGVLCIERLPLVVNQKTQHAFRWQRRGAERVLCRGMEDVYLLEPGSTPDRHVISRIDAREGHFRGSLEVEGAEFFCTNTTTPRATNRDVGLRGAILFLCYGNGWIIALKETVTIPGA